MCQLLVKMCLLYSNTLQVNANSTSNRCIHLSTINVLRFHGVQHQWDRVIVSSAYSATITFCHYIFTAVEVYYFGFGSFGRPEYSCHSVQHSLCWLYSFQEDLQCHKTDQIQSTPSIITALRSGTDRTCLPEMGTRELLSLLVLGPWVMLMMPVGGRASCNGSRPVMVLDIAPVFPGQILADIQQATTPTCGLSLPWSALLSSSHCWEWLLQSPEPSGLCTPETIQLCCSAGTWMSSTSFCQSGDFDTNSHQWRCRSLGDIATSGLMQDSIWTDRSQMYTLGTDPLTRALLACVRTHFPCRILCGFFESSSTTFTTYFCLVSGYSLMRMLLFSFSPYFRTLFYKSTDGRSSGHDLQDHIE